MTSTALNIVEDSLFGLDVYVLCYAMLCCLGIIRNHKEQRSHIVTSRAWWPLDMDSSIRVFFETKPIASIQSRMRQQEIRSWIILFAFRGVSGYSGRSEPKAPVTVILDL